MPPRLRADRLLVERGLFESRAKAQAAIAAGLVTADGLPVRESSDKIAVDAILQARPASPWVSRGGTKLAAALDAFNIEVKDRVCLDVGASTGGFTHVLVERGARRVYAVDVGHGQFHARLRGRSEVVLMEGADIRKLDGSRLPEKPDIVVVDVSFISLKLVLAAALALAAPGAHLLALVKPQFEVGRRHLKKGIVRGEAIHAQVCDEIASFIASLGWTRDGTIASPITGGDGNQEFFIAAHHD